MDIIADPDVDLTGWKVWNFGSSQAKDYFYAARYNNETRKVEYLHRTIMGAKKGEVVDHINRNTLDNRRCNLRLVSTRVNSVNSRWCDEPNYYWSKCKNAYIVRLRMPNGKRLQRQFQDVEAAKAFWHEKNAERLQELGLT